MLMPHSFSYAVSMNKEHSIKEGSHERYPDHLQCFRNIKNKIKYPDFQAMTINYSKMRNLRSAMEVHSRKWLRLLTFFHYVKMWLPAKDTNFKTSQTSILYFQRIHSSFLRNLFNRWDFPLVGMIPY